MRCSRRGFGLIDVIVGVALMLIMFLALFGVLKASLLVSSLARAKAGASSIAETQLEYLRGLSYASLGTIGGIPAGSIPQYATTTENGLPYVVHTFINYVDDSADGIGAADSNSITTDYKRALVTISYTIGGQEKSVSLVSNFAPPGLETTTNGGVLVVKAVNATGAPVADASVVITNTSLTPAVNIATFSNIDGLVSLPGAVVSSNYQIALSKSGYSSAQTYARDATNQNPNPGYLTIVKNKTTTGTFAIDALSTLSLSTLQPNGTTTAPLPNISFTLTGAKTIGTTGSGAPLYKTTVVGVTDATASKTLTLEWDRYTPTVAGYDIIDACPSVPFVAAPGSSSSVSLTLGAATANSLRVFVSNNAGAPVAGVSVTLSRSGYSNTILSSSCGAAYFGAITSANNYTVRIVKTGYTTSTFTNVSVSGAATYGATFP